MEKLLLCFLTFLSLSIAFSETDMSKMAFVFPKESDDSFAKLISLRKQPLEAFTLCLCVYSDLPRGYSIFSYNTRTQDNEILLFKDKPGEYSLSVGGTEVVFQHPDTFAPLHLCVTWESVSGIVEFWVNGKPKVRKSLKKGYIVGSEASIVLGHEQDSSGGSFDIKQCLVGDIGDVNMWDLVLSPGEINSVYRGNSFSPNVLNWHALRYEVHGEVFTKPQLWS
ncbi:C-reactive protein [Loxodonta africana]|uniref:C-reactive protein n=1 Tax=Loxodonta africana TaxID=9785 RepID=UPI0030CEAE3D